LMFAKSATEKEERDMSVNKEKKGKPGDWLSWKEPFCVLFGEKRKRDITRKPDERRRGGNGAEKKASLRREGVKSCHSLGGIGLEGLRRKRKRGGETCATCRQRTRVQ